MTGPAIELVGVTKRFRSVTAVESLSLEVPEGSLFGLIGPNGAGKTTTFGLLSGFLHPTVGEVRVRGELLSPKKPPVGRVLALPQDANLPDRMRALDALVMLGRLAGRSTAEATARASTALERVGLADVSRRKVGALSHGQRRRVGIAQTLIGDREVILLDEPTAGLDARSSAELRALIRELHQDRTIVLSSHNLQEVEALCDHAAILDRGRLVASGSMDQIKSTSTIVQVTLSRALDAPDRIVALLGGVPGVRRASVSEDRLAIDLELADAGSVEAAGAGCDSTSSVLRALLENGVSVKGVERGKSLEARFLEETGAAR